MEEFFLIIYLLYVYSFAGWVVEVIVGYFQRQRIINRGFLIGPVCPIYGFGGVFITLTLSKYDNDPLSLFLLSTVWCSILEYITSYLMEKLFKNRWWDYSDKKFNINGRICLEYALPFGMGALLIIYGINPTLFMIYRTIPIITKYTIISILMILTLIDFIFSLKTILTLKNISNSIICDNTEQITKKVKEILYSKAFPYKRLLDSFPNMKVFNKMSLLKDKININKMLLKKEKKKRKR